jgi:hypothetical protein
MRGVFIFSWIYFPCRRAEMEERTQRVAPLDVVAWPAEPPAEFCLPADPNRQKQIIWIVVLCRE